MSDLRTFDQISPGDADSVGGKGLSLGLLAAAGLPVPPGFCLTTAAFRRLHGRPLTHDPPLSAALDDATRALGEGVVAVRTSSTAWDGAESSVSRQQSAL